MLRVKEVAKRLNVHPATVYRWIQEGRLEAVRYGKPQVVGTPAQRGGGAIRIPEAALTGVTPTTEELAS